MKSYVLLFLLFSCFSGHSQTSLNNFKYVLVPESFSFLKQNDQYGINTRTKSLLEETGFTAYFDNAELPTGLANNKCTALIAEVVEKKSMFTTKLTLLLKDCKGSVVFKSKEGNSREKDFAAAYTDALEDAFKSLKETKYVYQPATAINDQPLASATASDSAPAEKSTVTVTPTSAGTLYAQPIANGYQLIDTTPKTILRMFKSSVADCFIADNGSSNGIVFKRDDSWVFEYYKDGKLMAEKLLIKF
ncbi:MAG TPA: hypothetical protein VK563_01190 [Puia sp.]|nr:hypothetical protein [Puia sp.]